MDWPVFTFQQVLACVRSELEQTHECVVDVGVAKAVSCRSGCVEVLWRGINVSVYSSRYVVDGVAFGNPSDDAAAVPVTTHGHTPITTLAAMLGMNSPLISSPRGSQATPDDGDFDGI